jgi:hypothetical protein
LDNTGIRLIPLKPMINLPEKLSVHFVIYAAITICVSWCGGVNDNNSIHPPILDFKIDPTYYACAAEEEVGYSLIFQYRDDGADILQQCFKIKSSLGIHVSEDKEWDCSNVSDNLYCSYSGTGGNCSTKGLTAHCPPKQYPDCLIMEWSFKLIDSHGIESNPSTSSIMVFPAN